MKSWWNSAEADLGLEPPTISGVLYLRLEWIITCWSSKTICSFFTLDYKLCRILEGKNKLSLTQL